MREQAIVLNQLTKHYGTHRGINDLSFSVNEGEFFGFIGPNGAGKSTTIRTLMGLIHPSGGNASIFGLDCQTKASVIAPMARSANSSFFIAISVDFVYWCVWFIICSAWANTCSMGWLASIQFIFMPLRSMPLNQVI